MENNLPAGWVKTLLDEAVFFQEGPGLRTYQMGVTGVPFLNIRTFNDDETLDKSKCKFIKLEEFSNKYEHFLLDEGDIVVSSSGTLGKVIVIRKQDLPISLNTSVIRFRSLSEKLLTQRFLKYFLSSEIFFRQIQEQKTGMAIDNYGPSHLHHMQIVIPPHSEQNRIVTKLDGLFEKIESNKQHLEKIPKILKRFRQSVLSAAVSGKLTDDWREENKQAENAESILLKIKHEKSRYLRKNKEYINESLELPALPHTWLWATWDDYLDYSDNPFRRGPFGSTLRKEIFISSGYKVYEQYCPINDDCSYARYFIDSKKYSELKNFAVKAGDFLISCSGVTLGRITQVPEKYDQGIINQALLRVRINKAFIDNNFFLMLFRSPAFQKTIFDNSTGSAIPNVKGVNELKSIPVPLLSLDEQLEIVKRVEQLFAFADTIETRYIKAKAMLDKLPTSILAKAFRGELVPQDPNDEPASVLLERLKTEKDKINSRKKKEKGNKYIKL